MPSDSSLLTIPLSKAELALLKQLAFPCSEDVLATARQVNEGFEISGTWMAFDDLVGWVAGEANHSRRHRGTARTALLDNIADELEDLLAAYRR